MQERGGAHVTTEQRVGSWGTSQGVPAATRSWEKRNRFSPRTSGGSTALLTSSRFPLSNTVSNHHVWGNLLQQL